MKLLILSAVSLLAGFTSLPLRAAVVLLDAKTVSANNGDFFSSSAAIRLFMDSDQATAAPLGTTIWLVADTLKNGLPTAPDISSVLGADDLLVYSITVSGSLGPVAGRWGETGISYDGASSQISNSDLYLYLWNGTGAGFTPVGGSTFGIGQLSVTPIGGGFPNPDFFLALTSNVAADQFAISLVPEVSEMMVLTGGSLSAFALIRHRRNLATA